MKTNIVKASVCVPRLKCADPDYNAQQIIAMVKAQKDTALTVFPELSVSAYTCADLFFSAVLLDGVQKALRTIAEETADCPLTLAVGAPLKKDSLLYNCAVVISAGKILGAVPKAYIPAYGEFYESRWFASGRGIENETIMIAGEEVPFGSSLLFEDKNSGAVLGLEICEDLWVADKPSSRLCLGGANLIANLSASDEVIGKQEFRRNMVIMQAAACYCGYLYVSSGMDESSTDLVFSGHAMIADSGALLKESIFANDICLDALIDLDKISYNRTHQTTFENQAGFTRISTLMPALKAETPEALAARLIEEQAPVARNPFIPSDTDEMAMRCEKILRIQAHGLATRVRATGIRKLVIGISGGLDSTLALIVCHEAAKIEKDIHIIAVTMPSQGNTTSLTYNNAMGLMKALADEIRVVPIGDTVRMHLADIGHAGSYQGEGDTAYENAQARMRTYILMDIANMENGLVVGTGDLSELALGWCTYNGDHMSMYGVNASVPKTLVKFICRSYALTCGDEALKDILFSIADTPISPELTPSKDGLIAQKTEDKIGKYDLNDFFLFYTLRYGMEPKKLLAYAYAAYHELPFADLVTALQRFYRRFFSQQFKRSCLPDGPKVGSVTLSPRGDWRMPSDAAAGLWLRETGQAAPKEE